MALASIRRRPRIASDRDRCLGQLEGLIGATRVVVDGSETSHRLRLFGDVFCLLVEGHRSGEVLAGTVEMSEEMPGLPAVAVSVASPLRDPICRWMAIAWVEYLVACRSRP